MKEIQCVFSRYYELANQVGTDIYIDLTNSCVDVGESVETDGVLPTPSKRELYPIGRALQDYLSEEDLDTSGYSNDWKYIYETESNYEFYEYYNQIIDRLMADWCAENQIEIVFNA